VFASCLTIAEQFTARRNLRCENLIQAGVHLAASTALDDSALQLEEPVWGEDVEVLKR